MDPRGSKKIEEWLDTALKHYGEAEPRPGLESRVLANVRAERQRITVRRWKWWRAIVAMAAVLLIGGLFLARPRWKAKFTPMAKENAGAQAKPDRHDYPALEQATHNVARVNRSAPRRRIETSAAPRAEQFPSPQPLSEQETLLAQYIEQFPREATLMARAQTELTRQEMLERETQAVSPILDPELQTQ